MRRFTFADLGSDGQLHVAARIVAGHRLGSGGLAFHTAGQRAHADEPRHTHAHEEEIFCIMQGHGTLELDDRVEPLRAGDVVVIEPGENHHVVSSTDSPLMNLWLHPVD